jgi:hypothetical protein
MGAGGETTGLYLMGRFLENPSILYPLGNSLKKALRVQAHRVQYRDFGNHMPKIRCIPPIVRTHWGTSTCQSCTLCTLATQGARLILHPVHPGHPGCRINPTQGAQGAQGAGSPRVQLPRVIFHMRTVCNLGCKWGAIGCKAVAETGGRGRADNISKKLRRHHKPRKIFLKISVTHCPVTPTLAPTIVLGSRHYGQTLD